jgi:hypothetical protein
MKFLIHNFYEFFWVWELWRVAEKAPCWNLFLLPTKEKVFNFVSSPPKKKTPPNPCHIRQAEGTVVPHVVYDKRKGVRLLRASLVSSSSSSSLRVPCSPVRSAVGCDSLALRSKQVKKEATNIDTQNKDPGSQNTQGVAAASHASLQEACRTE